MATQRSEYRAAVAVIGVIPLAYLALVVAGVDSAVAGMWALGFAAGVGAIALTRYARTSPAPTMPDDVTQRRPLWRAAVLLVLVLLVESILSGLIGAYAPVADGRLHDTLDTVLGLPVGMVLTFGLGVWSSGRSRSAGPLSLAWLAAVALGSRAIRLLLYWAAVAYSRPRGIAVHGWGYTVVRTILLGVLILCVLSLGSRYGQRRNANTGTMSR